MDIIGVLLHVFEDTATISKSEMSAPKDIFVVALQMLPVARATGPLSLVVDYVRHHQVRLEPIRYRGEIEIIGTNPEDRPPPADLVVFQSPGPGNQESPLQRATSTSGNRTHDVYRRR